MASCRACLATDKPMVQIDETFVINYNLLTSLNISKADGLPQYSCCSCSKIVSLFIQFREKTHDSELQLRQSLCAKLKSEDDSTATLCDGTDEDLQKHTVKVEYEDDIYYDFEAIDDDDCILPKTEDEPKPKRKRVRTKPKAINKVSNTKKEGNVQLKKLIRIVELLPDKLFCGLCTETFDEQIELNKHLESHKANKNCNQCSDYFDSWSQQLAHRLKHVPTKQMRCYLCDKRFISCEYLEFHYRNEHFPEEGKELICKFCFESYTHPKKFKKHLWSSHGKKNYICDYCSKPYHTKSVLRNHILSKHQKLKRFACDECDYASKFYGGLREHKLRKHSTVKFVCPKCDRLFHGQKKYDKHIITCNQMIFVCPVCGRQFRTKASFKAHLDRHTDVARYECKRCPAKFKSSGGLKAHMDRHDGNRTQQCKYCPAKFYAPSTLIKHRRTHTGERPYVCRICSKGFTGNNNLKLHMRVHGEHDLIKKKVKEPTTNEV